ncbi:putative orfan [Tupanvirus soda lake]|uniref:Orfan n=2 Tax=Tupanvirus TaxID=2094720 RepID=A0AC62ADA1_9VIRU|nr:putative orfan [Tupanvirus soda lake]QKU35766.1 putative orfan [Tupanvirus soda lake]
MSEVTGKTANTKQNCYCCAGWQSSYRRNHSDNVSKSKENHMDNVSKSKENHNISICSNCLEKEIGLDSCLKCGKIAEIDCNNCSNRVCSSCVVFDYHDYMTWAYCSTTCAKEDRQAYLQHTSNEWE